MSPRPCFVSSVSDLAKTVRWCRTAECPLPGLKQTCRFAPHMSAIGPKQTSASALHMSAFGGKADMTLCGSPHSRSLLGIKRTYRFALHMSAFDPKRTFQLFSRHPPRCISLGGDLASNNLDVTAQIIELVGKG